MSTTRTTRRFALPITLAAVAVATTATVSIVSAGEGADLPEMTAEELLVHVQNSHVDGLSGDVVQNAELGLPDLGDADGPAGLASGGNNLRIWYADPDKVRLAWLNDLGETDVIRNGEDVWLWDSRDTSATHYTLPERAGDLPLWPPAELGAAFGSPAEAAEYALDAIDDTTEVTTERTVEVADRDAYELVLRPRDDASLVSEIRLAVDGETGVPLRTRVYADTDDQPAFEIAFSRIEFEVPDEENFTFTPPSGVEVEEGTEDVGDLWDRSHDPAEHDEPRVVGEGWTAVLVTEFDLDEALPPDDEKRDGVDLTALVDGLPEVSGDWGSGRLFESTLVNALITDDGRLLVGAVTPERLYEVASTA